MDWISDLIAFCAPCSGFGRQWDSDRHPQGWKERCQAQKWCSVSKYFWDLSRDRYVLLPQSRLVPVLCPDHPRKYDRMWLFPATNTLAQLEPGQTVPRPSLPEAKTAR